MDKNTLRLFCAVQIEDKAARYEMDRKTFLDLLKNGVVIDPAIKPTRSTITAVKEIIGMDGERANAAFHKSWDKVANASLEQLVAEQMMHYFSTYGLEFFFGMDRKDKGWVPAEELKIPNVEIDGLSVTLVHGLTRLEILDKIVQLGSSGIALHKETLNDLMEIVRENKYTTEWVTQIKNREFKALLYDHYGLVPSDPVDFLRWLVAKLTGQSLLIKNKALFTQLAAADSKKVDELMKKAPGNLASIFYRFKPLFLALRQAASNKAVFNKLRKDANRLHVPMPEDYLSTVTGYIKRGELDPDRLAKKLEDVNFYRKARLADAILYRAELTDYGTRPDSIVYRVRNGKGYASAFSWPEDVMPQTREALDVVHEAMVGDLKKSVEGKVFYIPAHIRYAVPSSEKQFTGYFPSGTSVTVDGDTLVGVHWVNRKDKRIDLDLSMMSAVKYGWDGGYRSGDCDILFSGDMTDAPAPNGATELFYFRGKVAEPQLIMLNYFNFGDGWGGRSDGPDEVEYDMLVASEAPDNFDMNYMVDPNNILARTRMKIDKKQEIIGLIASHNNKTRVYFYTTALGNAISARVNEQSEQSRSYLLNSMRSKMDLSELLFFAGAQIITEKPEDEEAEFVDLSPEALDKTTIVNLLTTE